MILVTGATGTIGKEVVKQLSQKGVQVRALVRNPEKATELKVAGVELFQGDLEKPETLDAACHGVEQVFLVSGNVPDQIKAETNLIHAAKKAGVHHIVKVSAFGADIQSPILFGRIHGHIENALKESGVPYTILQPHGFMQNFINFSAQTIAQGAIYAPMRDGKTCPIDTRDIASAAVTTLTEKGHEGKTYALTGPESISYAEIATIFSTSLGRPIAYVDVPPEAAKQGMLGAGMPEELAGAMIALYAVFAAGYASTVSSAFTDITKKPGLTMAQFVHDHSAAFKAA